MHVPLSQADMVTDEFRELNKETSKTLVERERERERKRRAPRGRRERERARQRARERENETEGERAREHGSLRWRFGGGATTAFILLRRAHPPTPDPHLL